MSEEKYTYTLPPCPWYEAERIQIWLEDMAARGKVLEKDGFFLGLACFRRTQPQKRKYRLQAVQKEAGLLSDRGDGPEDLELELAEDFGWEYVARWGSFYIYTTADPAASELHTDPAVASIALRTVIRRERWALVDALFWAVLYPLCVIRGGVVSTMLAMGTLWTAVTAGLLLTKLAGSIAALVHLRRLRKNYSRPGDGGVSWQSRGRRYNLGRLLTLALTLACLIGFLQTWSDDLLGSEEMPLAEFSGDVPFATMEELFSGDFTAYSYDWTNTVRRWSEPVAPENWVWDQTGQVKRPDGTVFSGGLEVNYHVLANELLARQLAWECYIQYRLERDFELLEISLPQVDYAVALRGQLHFDTVILRQGNTVLVAQMYQTGTETVPLEQWAAILAEGMQ